MASPVLHIKDSYYFEVPKPLWRPPRDTIDDFPNWWVRLDPDYQLWEAERIFDTLTDGFFEPDEIDHSWPALKEEFVHWQHDHANSGKPFDVFLRTQDWFNKKAESGDDWLVNWEKAIASSAQLSDYKATAQWEPEKITGYEKALHGKILIPQFPTSELKNLYEPAKGFCISKFMVIEVAVALIAICVFRWLGTKIQSGDAPKGKLWNMLEAILLFLRNEVARPAIGKHDADRFVPLLWTIFLFILGCNLMGMLPWVGSPTGSFAVTFGLACITFGTVLFAGSQKFGIVGFWLNLVPQMEMHWVLKYPIALVLFPIEVLGLLIKHGVLAVRLLANMVAGHLVLLAIMMLAFSAEGAMSPTWKITAVISIVGSTLFSCLELFVAFLQAYVFTYLSALFIGAATHKH